MVETTGLELLMDLFAYYLRVLPFANDANFTEFLYQIASPNPVGYMWLKGKIRVTSGTY